MEEMTGADDMAAGQEGRMPDTVAQAEWYENVGLEGAEAYISANLKAAARNVIAIGYYLKHIRDRGLYQEAGYADIWTYAHDRYGFSKSTTSRYMSRNDKFSRNGNSPILDDKYRDYGKAQMQEMLSLDEEQLEQVTPDMTARQIREMKKPKEAPVPYVELPGQVELLDLLSDPMEDKGDIQAGGGQVREGQQGRCTVVSVSDLLPGTEERTSVATSQQDEDSSCPPQVTGCRRQEWGTSPEQQQAGQKECAKCWAEYKERQRILGAAGAQQSADPAAGLRPGTMRIEADREQRASKEDDTKKGDDGWISEFYKDLYPSTRQVIVQRDRAAITKEFRKFYGDTYENGEGWSAYPDKIVFRDSPGAEQIQIVWGRLTTKLIDFLERYPEVEKSMLVRDADPQGEGDGIRDRILCDTCEHNGECAGKKTHSDGCMGYEESSVEGRGLTVIEGDAEGLSVKAYDKRILEKMIAGCEGKMAVMQEYWMQGMPDVYTEHMMQLRAYQDLLAAKEAEEAKGRPADQPPIPLLKNNDQRKDWLDTFHDWPVWFEVQQASEVYYRYDLEDGYSLVICEYHYYLKWMEKHHEDPERIGTREYILTPGYHYLHDCQASRTVMVEHLKKMQRKG